jgi:hypothetical protein
MTSFLASAEQTDLSGSGWFVILTGATVILVVAALTVIPIVLARRHLSRRAEALTVAALFWGLLAAASVVHFWLARMEWSKEYLLLLKTGYYDPSDTSGAPPWPWQMWGALAVAYGALVAFSLSRKRPPSSPPSKRGPS